MKQAHAVRINALVVAILMAIAFAITHQTIFASGGTTTGGGGGGGGGTGGGGTGGGGGTVTPPPSYIQSMSAIGGYRPGGGAAAAIWTSYSVRANPAVYTPYVKLRITDLSTGQYVWNVNYTFGSQTVDDDWVSFNGNFLVEVQVLDSSANVVDSRGATVMTPAPRDPTVP